VGEGTERYGACTSTGWTTACCGTTRTPDLDGIVPAAVLRQHDRPQWVLALLEHVSQDVAELTQPRRAQRLLLGPADLPHRGARPRLGEPPGGIPARTINRFLANDFTHGGDGIFIRVLDHWCSTGNLFEGNDCSHANNNAVEAWSPGNTYVAPGELVELRVLARRIRRHRPEAQRGHAQRHGVRQRPGTFRQRGRLRGARPLERLPRGPATGSKTTAVRAYRWPTGRRPRQSCG